jgi:hypothetical protein
MYAHTPMDQMSHLLVSTVNSLIIDHHYPTVKIFRLTWLSSDYFWGYIKRRPHFIGNGLVLIQVPAYAKICGKVAAVEEWTINMSLNRDPNLST